MDNNPNFIKKNNLNCTNYNSTKSYSISRPVFEMPEN